MTRIDTIRFIQDPALTGPENMGRDEALLQRVGRGDSPPTLRLYRWNPPTISLGYFQRYADYEALPPPAGELAVVRRQTGGGAILHDQELTYALVLPAEHPLLEHGPTRLYDTQHKTIMRCLSDAGIASYQCGHSDDSGAAKGPFFCFARRHGHDVLIDGDKLVGSAQRRTKDGVLQHGSIIFGHRFDQQVTARVNANTEAIIETLTADLPRRLSQMTGITLEPGNWTQEELTEAAPLINKHAGAEWLRRT